MRFEVFLFIGILGAGLFVTHVSEAEIVYDPSNYLENSATNLQTASIMASEITQIQYALNNAKNYGGGTGQWSNLQSELMQLGNVIQQGQALSYSQGNVSNAFQQKYPGYQPTQNYSQAYQGWSGTTLDTLRGILSSVGMQAGFLGGEQSRLAGLEALSQTSTGRMQAIQAGSMIASESVGQLQQLRQLMMAQTNEQNTFMAYQVQQDQANQANLDNWTNAAQSQNPGYADAGYGPNNVPHP